MIPHRALPFAVAIGGILVFAAAATAAPRHVQPVAPGTPVHEAFGTPPCQLGVVGAPAQVGDLFPPDDVYYTLLKPSSCGPCSLTVLSYAHVWLEFREPCSMAVRVSAVKAFGTTCLIPDLGQVLFAPLDTVLVADEPGIIDFAIPLPANWKLLDNSFLSVAFPAVTDSCAESIDQPRIVLTDACAPCTSYEYFAGSLDDVCPGATGLPIFSVDVAECVPTPTLPRSWGAVKILYR